MEYSWSEDQPIYRQLMNEIITLILSGQLRDGDALPSIRKLASEFQVNPLTVSKACQELSSNNIVDKQRGIGLFVRKGARQMLLRSEKEKFLRNEWPDIVKRMQLMGIDPDKLLTELHK